VPGALLAALRALPGMGTRLSPLTLSLQVDDSPTRALLSWKAPVGAAGALLDTARSFCRPPVNLAAPVLYRRTSTAAQAFTCRVLDVVSRLDLAEVDNALAGIDREIATRFDFKGSKCMLKREEGALSLVADDDLKLRQMHELLKVHLTRRKVDPAALDFKPPEKASGNLLRQSVVLRQGSIPSSPASWCARSRTAS